MLNDGEYTDVNILFPKALHDITIKAKGANAVIIPKGREEDSAFTFPNVARQSEQVHNINFIGLKITGSHGGYKQFVKSVMGRWVDGGGGLHDFGEDNPKYGAYNIYFYNIETESLFMGLYSGLYAHDWTVDSCRVKTSKYSHFWYMMGWHLSVVNSTFEDSTHDTLAIRGYYPQGEVHTYIDRSSSTECYGNIYVKDRKSRSVENGFLPINDWTHIIRDNTFKRVSTIRDDENPYVAIAYSIYQDDPICGAEKTYMPPQNIEISHNEFNNMGEENSATTNGVEIDGYSGINNSTLAAINGISIYNNIFYRTKGGEKFIMTDDSNTNLDDLNTSSVKNNKTVELP